MIRASDDGDAKSIREVLDAAFSPSRYETRLRDLAVRDDPLYSEWVFEQDSRVVGHVLYTPAYHGEDVIGRHIAPVAVHPEFQRQGIGTALVRETIDFDPIAGESVFVLGDPRFYERFGFVMQTSARCPFDPGNEHFRALRWDDEREEFEVGYSPVFTRAEHDSMRTRPGADFSADAE